MLRDISIRYKIILIILTIFIFISGILFVVFSISESQKQQKNLEKQASFLAKFTADYCSAPLIFEIQEETTEILNKLSSSKQVVYTSIYNAHNKLFDSYNPHALNLPQSTPALAKTDTIYKSSIQLHNSKSSSTIVIQQPILYEGVSFGTIVLCYSLDEAWLSVKKSMRTAAITITLILLIVYLLAFLLQKIISDPILALANFANRVKKDADYTAQIKIKNSDEIGVLYASFNNMLEEIHIRDQRRDKNEAELKEARYNAENADKLKSAFLANMSHEIRTPMNSIIGFSGLLSDPEIEPSEKQEFIELINSSSRTLLHLIDDILDISKIEAGQLNISNEKCDIPALLNELYLSFNETNQSSNNGNVELKLDIPNNYSDLIIDSDNIRLKQIISNLISNAIKFTHKGHITFGYSIIEKIKHQQRTKYVKFFVKDTGIGMTPEISEVVFNRFTKIESDNDKLYRGAGLGLTITKRLLELLDGDIWVESEPNKGSAFYFTLPTPDNLEHSELVIPPTQHIENSSSYSIKDKSILVVEDDASNFELLNAILKKSGANVTWAQNGLLAIEACSNNVPDLILMDIKMPEMDGYETVIHLREMGITVPIIAQTAFARLDDEKLILNSGFNAYLSKPIERKKLMAKLAEIFPDA